jgi:hypothetical protein
MEKTLYYAVDSIDSLQYIQGRLAYDFFDSTVVLSRDDELRQFRQELNEMRSGTATKESWKLLLGPEIPCPGQRQSCSTMPLGV